MSHFANRLINATFEQGKPLPEQAFITVRVGDVRNLLACRDWSAAPPVSQADVTLNAEGDAI